MADETVADQPAASTPYQDADEFYLMQGSQTLDRKARLDALRTYILAALSTSSVAEGSNLYYTAARVYALLAAPGDASLTYAVGSFALNTAHANAWSAQQTFNGGIVCTGATGKSQIDASYGSVEVVAYALAITLDMISKDLKKLILTGNVTFAAPSNWQIGQALIIDILQNSAGNHTITWFAGIDWGIGGEPTPTTDPSTGDKWCIIKMAVGVYHGLQSVTGIAAY